MIKQNKTLLDSISMSVANLNWIKLLKKAITQKDLKQFGIALGVILGLIGALQLNKGHVSISAVLCLISMNVLICGFFIPEYLRGVYLMFSKITNAIGWFNTRVILAVIYYISVCTNWFRYAIVWLGTY